MLTLNGLALVEHVQAMANAASQFSLVANGQPQSIEGTVCISASEVHCVFFLPPIIAKLRHLAPKIKVEIVATNKVSDLRQREADIAIRNFRPTHPELIAKKIKDVVARLYATPTYINSLGDLETLSRLDKADFISFDASGMLMSRLNAMGMNLTQDNFPIITQSYLTHWELVK